MEPELGGTRRGFQIQRRDQRKSSKSCMIVVSYKLERISAAKSTNIKIIDVKADLKNVLVDWLDGWDHGKASDKITDS